MAIVDITVKVSKETNEFGDGMADFVGAVKKALANGWQIGQDLPVVVKAALQHLVPAIQGMEAIGDEIKEDKVAFANALMLSLTKTVDHFVK